MTDTLFDQGNDQVIVDENIDYLAELTKPGAKFDRTKYESEEAMYKDIAKGKYVADRFIQNKNHQYDVLYDEYGKAREELTAGASLKELIDQLKTVQNSSRETNPNSNEPIQPATQSDPEELKKTVNSLLSEMKVTERETNNYNLVQQKLKERFGANAGTHIKEKAETLGLSENDVNTMARKNPALFYKTFDIDVNTKVENFQLPPQTQQRSEGFAPKTTKRTQSYYDKLRRENPREFLKPSTVIQMDKDAQALGQEFFDLKR